MTKSQTRLRDFFSFFPFSFLPFLPFFLSFFLPFFLSSFLSFFLSTAGCERIWIWHWQSFQLMDPSLLNGGSHMGPVYRGRLWPIYSTYSIWQNDGVHFDKAFLSAYSMLVPGWTRYYYLVYLHFSQSPWKDYSHLTTGDSKVKGVVQWLRFHAPNADSQGLIPAQGTRSCMLQLRVFMP